MDTHNNYSLFGDKSNNLTNDNLTNTKNEILDDPNNDPKNYNIYKFYLKVLIMMWLEHY
jgi:hypothetical protein